MTARPRRARLAALAGVVVLLAGVLLGVCTRRVGVAQVGIRVELAGTDRGVDDTPIVTGWVLYNPLTEVIVVFPTHVQTIVWGRSPDEGGPRDESISFSSTEGVDINADVGLSFHVDPAKVPHLYARFRKSSLEELADGYVRNAVREAFNVAASRRTVESIYGRGKTELLDEVKALLEHQIAADGFLVDQLTFNSALRLPERVAAALNRALEATQLAVQAENRVRQIEAEAEQAVTEAEGIAEARRARARGDADARLITAGAEAKANELLRLSATPAVLQYRALERWSGQLPTYSGDASPITSAAGGAHANAQPAPAAGR